MRPARSQRQHDRGDPLLERAVENHLAAAELADHGRGEIVCGGPEAAARDDQVDLDRRAPLECREHVGRTVADDRDVGELDAELEQPLGEPGAVTVADTAAEDLRAGHDDRRARAHEQRGACPGGSFR